jgi:hypothetical protein
VADDDQLGRPALVRRRSGTQLWVPHTPYYRASAARRESANTSRTSRNKQEFWLNAAEPLIDWQPIPSLDLALNRRGLTYDREPELIVNDCGL